MTFPNSPRTFVIIKWRTLKAAVEWDVSIVHVVLFAAVLPSVVLVVCMVVSWFPDR